jgi:hypothetical protein
MKKTSKKALIILGAAILVLLGMLYMRNSGTTPTDEPQATENAEAPATEAEEAAPEGTAGEKPVAPRAPAVNPTEVDAALEALDSALEEGEYDTSNVTELFNDTSDESLTDPYDI